MAPERDCGDCGRCESCVARSAAHAEAMADDRHWSEQLPSWYFVSDVFEQWDFICHDVEAEDLTGEVAGMHLLYKDGTATPAPTTRTAWRFLVESLDIDADEPVCVGKVVDGMCVPIGTDEGDEDE